ncbi:hypothetical protein BH11PSE14_BH11PSE14_11510 [soil metagenome]
MIRVLAILFAIALSGLAAAASPADDFWAWFSANDAEYFKLDLDNVPQREPLFDKLSSRLTAVNPELTFEFGPLINGRRDFVISAGGIKSAFPAVEQLVKQAPRLPNWNVIAFRPRRHPVSVVQIGSVSLDPERVLVELGQDDKAIGLVVYIDGYFEDKNAEFGQAAYLLLDEALGEYDVETKVGYVEFRPMPAQAPKGCVSMAELATAFDGFRPGA